MPQKPLLPDGVSTGVLQGIEDPRQHAAGRAYPRFAELLSGREIKEQIRFNESFCWEVAEHKFFVHVPGRKNVSSVKAPIPVCLKKECVDLRGNILPHELPIKLLAHLRQTFTFLAQHPFLGWNLPIPLLIPQTWQGIWSNYHRVRPLFMPILQKNVVFLVEGSDVGDTTGAEGLEFGFEGWGQGDGAEDGEVVGGELDDSAAATYFDASEAEKGSAAGEDGGGGAAEEHHFFRVGGDEIVGFGGHDVLWSLNYVTERVDVIEYVERRGVMNDEVVRE